MPQSFTTLNSVGIGARETVSHPFRMVTVNAIEVVQLGLHT